MLDPWSWNTYDEDEGMILSPGAPFHWDTYSLLSDFLCSLEPNEPIFTMSQLEGSTYEKITMELFAIMQRSPATAEGTYRLMLDPRASAQC